MGDCPLNKKRFILWNGHCVLAEQNFGFAFDDDEQMIMRMRVWVRRTATLQSDIGD